MNEDIQARLKVQMRRAFFDSIEHRMEKQPVQAIEWLVSLHGEVRDIFCAIIPSKAAEVKERLDTELFAQQMRAGTYGSEQMGPLIEYTWTLLRTACAPDMDEAVQKAYTEVAGALVPGAQFSQVVPLYLRLVHTQLDEIILRVRELHD
jgi:hypothetical protein